MKKSKFYFQVTCALLFLVSCHKDKDTVTPVPALNHPPVARAGSDQKITLPVDSVKLDGSGSYDPDGADTIAVYEWTLISGPGSPDIVNPSAPTTEAKNLKQGIYQFKLKVTDRQGFWSEDLVSITVDAAPMQTKQIVNPDLHWSFNYTTKTAMAIVTDLALPPNIYPASSISAVYILNDGAYREILDVPSSNIIYYQVENSFIVLHKNNIRFAFDFPIDALFLPKAAKVTFL